MSESNRKTIVFSVSWKPDDMEAVEAYLKELEGITGFELKKNPFIRKAAIATAKFLRKDNTKTFEEIYKEIK